MATPEQSAETMYSGQTELHTIPANGIRLLGNPLPITGIPTLRNEKGVSTTSEVVAVIRGEERDREVLVMRTKEGMLWGVPRDAGENAQRSDAQYGVGVLSFQISSHIGVKIDVTPVADEDYWCRIRTQSWDGNGLEVLTAPETSVAANYWGSKRSIREKRIARAKASIKKIRGVAAAIALFLTFEPNGLIDTVYGAALDPAVIVRQADAPLLQPYESPDEPHDAGYGPDVLNPIIASENAKIERYIDATAQAMTDLKSHNYNHIHQKAEEYRKRHADDLWDENEYMATQTNVRSAHTLQELQKAMRPFSDYSGIRVDYEGNALQTSTEALTQAKEASEVLITNIGSLPHSLIELSDAQEIVFSSENLQRYCYTDRGSVAAGCWSSDSQTIRIRLFPALMKALINPDPNSVTLDFISGNPDYSSSIMHEFGHSISPQSFPTYPTLSISTWSPTISALGQLWNSPNYPSWYAGSNPQELWAEIFSSTFSTRRNGLADPNDGRAFSSRANRSELLLLTATSQVLKDPDYVYYQLSSNTRLDPPQ